MKVIWNPAAISEAVRQVVLALILFGVIHWTESQLAGVLMALSAVLALFTITNTTPNSTLEAAGTSKTQVVTAADANIAMGTPGGTGSPNVSGGAGGPEAPKGLGNFSHKDTRGTGTGVGLMIALMLVPAFLLPACAKKPAVLIGQAGVISVDSINAVYEAVVALNLPREKELPVQRTLFKANEALAPVPELIIAIDNATKAGNTAATEVDKALSYLASAAQYLDSVNGDLKAVPTAAAVIKLVAQLQSSITTLTRVIQQVKAPVPKAAIDDVMLRPALAN